MLLSSRAQTLIDDELRVFSADFKQHFLEKETKPSHIGRPFLLHCEGAEVGILLVHGLMAAPEEVRQWAEYLHQMGYTVYAPRMAGHGTSAVDLSHRTMNDWVDSVNRGHDILKCICPRIVVAGFSTGGAIALHQVINKPQDFEALISISAPLRFKKFSAHFAAPVNCWNIAVNKLENLGIRRAINTSYLKKEYVTNHADNPHINYLRCPVNGIVQIKKLMRKVYGKLSSISIPTLIIHADGDPKVDVTSAHKIFKVIASENKVYREIEYHQHGIIRGEIAKSVFDEVGIFLRKNIPLPVS